MYHEEASLPDGQDAESLTPGLMSSDVPEYYRHLLEQSGPPDPPPKSPPPPGTDAPKSLPATQGLSGGARRDSGLPARAAATAAPMYRADTFALNLEAPWQDQSLFIFAGPIENDIQHTLTVVVDRDVPVDSLVDYVDWQLLTLEKELSGYQLLKRDPVTLHSGVPAYRVIYRWSPREKRSLYQEQLYVLHKQTGFKLTATFTKTTRKTLGPAVEQMMLSFTPIL